MVFVFRDVSARDDLEQLRAEQQDRNRAEQIAGDYAVHAATLDYKDLTPWISAMKTGVSPELQRQYDVVGSAMEQVLTPLRMQTTAALVSAKTIDVAGNNFRVQAAVNMDMKTAQLPGGSNTVAVYSLTIDKGNGWTITSVGDPTSAIIPFGIIVTVQIGNIINQLGAQSLLGAGSGFAVIQQAAPLAAGMLLGGAGASAIAADLGARTVREEIDAMRTMGIDPVARLVVPRVLAAVVVAPLIALFIVLVGVLSAYYLAITFQDVGPGSYWQSFGSFSSVRDIFLALFKAVVFGFIIAVVGCQRGLEARGGPRGVADGVNATVVVSTVGIIGVNLVLTLVYTVFFPIQLG